MVQHNSWLCFVTESRNSNTQRITRVVLIDGNRLYLTLDYHHLDQSITNDFHLMLSFVSCLLMFLVFFFLVKPEFRFWSMNQRLCIHFLFRRAYDTFKSTSILISLRILQFDCFTHFSISHWASPSVFVSPIFFFLFLHLFMNSYGYIRIYL